jgi:quinol monooxygenase YgiN
MIIIAGVIDFDSKESRDAAAVGSAPFQKATRDDEPGCRAYCFAPDPVVDTRIQVYELWDDAPTLAAHFLHENYFNMRDFLRGSGMTGAENRKYRVDADAPVYNDDHVATVEF